MKNDATELQWIRLYLQRYSRTEIKTIIINSDEYWAGFRLLIIGSASERAPAKDKDSPGIV